MNDNAQTLQATASDVAKYMLDKKGSLTGYQIQKLLYYCQAWSMVVNGRPLFLDEIQAWEHGPVVPSVSRQHQHLRMVYAHSITGDASRLCLEDQRLIDAVLATYGVMSGDDLEHLTHNESPWANAYNGHTGSGAAVIERNAMAAYYSGLYASPENVRKDHCVPRFDHPRNLYVKDSDFLWLLDYLED
ncbi:Panacea domain-containing protein [Adlercreutzia sp. ZJ154]|uniref:Panacea domain-containing protein n=1 Tax=Adlercreutzia sp. ZJ154 TaxID=2709790 RepID=UPI0013EC9D08|nr:type II toxin-antitoxin system antitoxin SocA domain-containing protein [Adlercreutzia sp. ZJ154]